MKKIFTDKSEQNIIKIYIIYTVLFGLFLFKMCFYTDQRFPTPDVEAHYSYVVYMEDNKDKFIPDFESIKMYEVMEAYEENNQVYFRMEKEEKTCYLCHPPLYYKLMQLCGVAEIIDEDTAVLNHTRVTGVNILLTGVVMLIALVTGFYLLQKKKVHWCIHMLFATICTCLPLYGFIGGDVNNDNLCNLCMVIFWLGLISYVEEGYSYKTFWLVGIGITLAMLSKLTAGLIVLLVTAIVIVIDIIKTQKIGIVFNKYFLSSVPCYLVILYYYMSLYFKYSTFTLSYGGVASREEYEASSFFVTNSIENPMSLGEDFVFFLEKWWQTWTSTYNGFFMIERKEWFTLIYVIIIGLFIAVSIVEIIVLIKRRAKSVQFINATLFIAMLITLLRQFWGHYQGYLSVGYTGGYQARYYMPCIPIIAMGACEAIMMIKSRIKRVNKYFGAGVIIAMSMLLIYADFYYFLFNIYRLNVELW